MNRREFLGWVSVGCVAQSLPVAIAVSHDRAIAAPNPSRFVALGTVADLDARGQLVVTDRAKVPEKVIVIRDPADRSQVLARTANCNHGNCTVNWTADRNQFRCPCHNSQFALNGSINRGPATQALKPLEAKLENGQVWVKFS
ncbi:QcrA and Rieske domain-containing protein [Prochlorothrix hollandica]|uniref:Rieske domain-containing protein n=1 Tax=Prochlorothrix hollandica PCC 9006 = CALU 1027 TaxID=317619 RepID=A0A0M2Q272_PROHO|nr:Rieske 2Fe-2S domain-containing protein [Prochlorothrix hollandica]KKJ01358.1 hypothetical protein PROH_03120 [Prochlorothrix hollandica PCC 9006 = CALU 1027]